MPLVRRLMFFWVGMFFLFIPISVSAFSSPSAKDLQVFQGEERSIEIPLQNDTLNQKTVTFSLRHVGFDDNSEPVLGALAEDVPWLKIPQTSAVLKPGEAGSVTVTASPGDEIPSGSYVFALISTETQEGAFMLAHGTATLLFVTVGFVEPEAHCVAFERQDDGTFLLTLQNLGQGILYDEGSIVLRGPFDIAYTAVLSNPSRHRIFAGQTRAWASEQLTIPWWAVGALEYSLESDFFSSTCPRFSAGFGWIPVGIVAAGAAGAIMVRRRK